MLIYITTTPYTHAFMYLLWLAMCDLYKPNPAITIY